MRRKSNKPVQEGMMGSAMKKILIVEDDTLLNTTLVYNLQEEKLSAASAFSCAQARKLLETERYDMTILDVNLPDGDGFSLCREFKKNFPAMAVLLLTANDLERDMLKGFELGAADYVSKPFPVKVLVKKVKTLLQLCSTRQEQADGIYEDGELRIDLRSLRTVYHGKEIQFTPLEYRLLEIFTSNPGIVLTRQKLLEKLWDEQENYVDEHTLTTVISRVRGKLEGEYPYIKTVYGMGYLWNGRQERRL